jgi:hypothetical protein
MRELSLALRGFGVARADLASIAAMRKSRPAWAPPDTPGHFLKHADEQTVVAVAALDHAVQAGALQIDDCRQWAIIAAPRFIGRSAGAVTLDRFGRGGGPAISPHVIPQHSLHSISGALSILLGSRQPNFGVGGTADSLAEGLLAALTLPSQGCCGVWLVGTAWDPEPQVDKQGQCQDSPVCFGVALALKAAADGQTCGQLHLRPWNGPMKSSENGGPLNAAGLSHALAALTPTGPSDHFVWQLSWGGALVLEVRAMTARLGAAA